MPQPPKPYLTNDFDAPFPRARLDVLLLLAQAVRPSLKDLRRTFPERWHEVVTRLAEVLALELEDLTRPTEAAGIWRQFLAGSKLARLGPDLTPILDAVFDSLNAGLAKKDSCLEYLDQANQQAAAWIQEVGTRRQIHAFANVLPAPVCVSYDPEADEYCASSSRTTAEIAWKLQLKEHTFYGALIPDMLFEHEYISHLLPPNQHLSRAVRELWLSRALFQEHRNQAWAIHQKQANLFLWNKFRRELARHFDSSDILIHGPLGLEDVAANLSFSAPHIFWGLTDAILHLEETSERSDQVDKVLAALAEFDDDKLDYVSGLEWKDIDVFARSVSLISYL